MTHCRMLAYPPQGEREPLGTGDAGWRVIHTHSPGLAPPWALTGRLVSPPQEAPPSRDRPVTPTASHPADAAGLPGDTAVRSQPTPDPGLGGQPPTLRGTEAVPRQGAALGPPQLQPA